MSTTLHGRLRSAVEELPGELQGSALRDVAELESHEVLDAASLAHLLRSDSSPDRLRAIGAWAVGALREVALVPQLEEVIQRADTPEALLWEATKALCRLGRGVKIFRQLLLDGPTAQGRKAAAYALGCLVDRDAIVGLCRVLDSSTEDSSVRGQAAEALGYLGDRSAYPHLIEAASDPSAEVRYWAVFALGQLGDHRAEPLLDRLRKEDPGQLQGWGTVAEEAARALEALRGSA